MTGRSSTSGRAQLWRGCVQLSGPCMNQAFTVIFLIGFQPSLLSSLHVWKLADTSRAASAWSRSGGAVHPSPQAFQSGRRLTST